MRSDDAEVLYDRVDDDPRVREDMADADDGYPPSWPRDRYTGMPVDPSELDDGGPA